jgi:hypothetical protein
MGPLSLPEFIFQILSLLFCAGLLAAIVYVVLTVHRIQRAVVQIEADLADLKAPITE